jgi:hypothetical protein
MKQNITYHGKGFRVDKPEPIRKGICKCCGRTCFTALHHWAYKFKVSEVRANTNLALENTTELCFPRCHDVGNAIRVIMDADPKIIDKLMELREKDLKEREVKK